MNGHHASHKVLLYCVIFTKVLLLIAIYNNTYSAGMKERCRDGCRTSLLIAGVVLVPNIFHTLLPPCHPYITIHFMEMIFSTCLYRNGASQVSCGCIQNICNRLYRLIHAFVQQFFSACNFFHLIVPHLEYLIQQDEKGWMKYFLASSSCFSYFTATLPLIHSHYLIFLPVILPFQQNEGCNG